MFSDNELRAALRRYWGYDSFRPLQEQIVRSLLAGSDVCVVMPTGGGKSLCYQLPAALLAGETAIVISPLIALMQDQVAQLGQMGIPSAVLNSSLTHEEQVEVRRKAARGEYRLLYLSPERLAQTEAQQWLDRVPVSLFAIDEAHCISEWGHEFRPDYRLLSMLRKRYPTRPIAAFTASATQRVRHDIIEQLQLRKPDKYIASFHRPNLQYIVRQTTARDQSALLLAALRRHSGSNVVVYAPTIVRVESTVDFLGKSGIAAISYHGRMDSATRRTNQERWMSDDVRVLVGTIAFGLGINKAAVRAVIHLALPKSIEQYYQEAGRGGRDGLPTDCLMLWQARDAGLLAHFAGQIADQGEQERAWERYHRIRDFAESRLCRHRQICLHFGETPKWASCRACDVCIGAPAWLTQREEKPAPRNGSAGGPCREPVPPAPARSLQGEAQHGDADSGIDPELREYLREWRRALSKEKELPAFIVMHDTTMEELCRIRPQTLSELRQVSGFGQHKTQTYGPQILDALERFRGGARAGAVPAKEGTTRRGGHSPAR